MSDQKVLVPMTWLQFEEYVSEHGCPECKTHFIHHDNCGLGDTWRSIIPPAAKNPDKDRREEPKRP